MRSNNRVLKGSQAELSPQCNFSTYCLEQEHFFMTGGIKKRKIFLNVQYTKEERKWIKMVRQALKKQNLFEVQDDSILLKIYYSSNFDMQKCLQKLKVHHSWFASPQIQCMTEESRLVLRDGFIYSYGKSINGRPFIILNLSLLDISRYQVNSYYQAINHIISRVVKQQFVPGHIEFFYFVIDLNELLLSLPFTEIAQIIGETTEAYNSCLQRMFIVNCTAISKWLFQRVTSFVAQETTSKFKFYTKQDLSEGPLLQYIDSDVLQRKYGGTKANIDHSKAFEQQQISEDVSQSTQYFSIEQNQPYQHYKEGSCCGNSKECNIY